jgi:hypothetical protein
VTLKKPSRRAQAKEARVMLRFSGVEIRKLLSVSGDDAWHVRIDQQTWLILWNRSTKTVRSWKVLTNFIAYNNTLEDLPDNVVIHLYQLCN